jgi:hypothetical protein
MKTPEAEVGFGPGRVRLDGPFVGGHRLLDLGPERVRVPEREERFEVPRIGGEGLLELLERACTSIPDEERPGLARERQRVIAPVARSLHGAARRLRCAVISLRDRDAGDVVERIEGAPIELRRAREVLARLPVLAGPQVREPERALGARVSARGTRSRLEAGDEVFLGECAGTTPEGEGHDEEGQATVSTFHTRGIPSGSSGPRDALARRIHPCALARAVHSILRVPCRGRRPGVEDGP